MKNTWLLFALWALCTSQSTLKKNTIHLWGKKYEFKTLRKCCELYLNIYIEFLALGSQRCDLLKSCCSLDCDICNKCKFCSAKYGVCWIALILNEKMAYHDIDP